MGKSGSQKNPQAFDLKIDIMYDKIKTPAGDTFKKYFGALKTALQII